jgi:hypothetical protein
MAQLFLGHINGCGAQKKNKKEKEKRMEKLNYEWRFSVIKIDFIFKFICVIY